MSVLHNTEKPSNITTSQDYRSSTQTSPNDAITNSDAPSLQPKKRKKDMPVILIIIAVILIPIVLLFSAGIVFGVISTLQNGNGDDTPIGSIISPEKTPAIEINMSEGVASFCTSDNHNTLVALTGNIHQKSGNFYISNRANPKDRTPGTIAIQAPSTSLIQVVDDTITLPNHEAPAENFAVTLQGYLHVKEQEDADNTCELRRVENITPATNFVEAVATPLPGLFSCQPEMNDTYVSAEGILEVPGSIFYFGELTSIDMILMEQKYSGFFGASSSDGLTVTIPIDGTKPNTMNNLGKQYTNNDAGVVSNIGTPVPYGQRVRVSGMFDVDIDEEDGSASCDLYAEVIEIL